jgi:hypothetical protein
MSNIHQQGTFSLFTGVVITNKAGTYVTTVVRESYMADSPDAGNTMQGIPISSAFATYLGFREISLPQPGDRVLCCSTSANSCFILGSIPQNNMSSKECPNRTNIGAGDPTMDTANHKGHEKRFSETPINRRPSDMVDGEWAVANEFGVMVGMFQQLAQLKASELAQIQCYLIDDLVRVIGHNFQHYSALGEYNIYHDGKAIMAEFGATHQPGECYGRPLVETECGGPIFAKDPGHVPDDSKDNYKVVTNERTKAIERFKIFLGRMGDFLHCYLCRPDPNEIRTLDPAVRPSKPDTGLADLHVGTDGGISVRSVKQVFIEKTNWIRVPLRCAAPEDVTADIAYEIDYEPKDKFEWKDDWKYKQNPFHYFLQLRDYVAYVLEKNQYRNIKKHPIDFYVNDDPGNEHNLKTINKVDNWTKLEQQKYELRTSGVYLMPNGGITIKDSWNSSIVMEGGNIYIQPAKDLVLQPLRSLIGKVGKHLQVAAKEQIDFSSTEGGFRLKTDKSQYFYSDKSGIVLEAKATIPTPGTPDPQEEAIEHIGGIVLKSEYGIYNYAKKEIVTYTEGRVVLKSLSQIFVETDNLLSLYSKSSLLLLSDKSLIADGATSSLFISSGGSVVCSGVGTTALGMKDENLGVMYDPDSIFIDIIKGVVPMDTITSKLAEVRPQLEDPLSFTLFSTPEKFTNLQFNFLKSDKYGQLSDTADLIPATMAQQDDKLTSMYGLTSWQETEVNSSLPYPGKDKFESFYLDADKPINLESNPTGISYSSKAESEPKPCELTAKSLQEYKIQS